MHAQMKARMEAEGLPYGERTMTYNSRLAQELGKWADTQPGGEAIHDALFRAYFVEARDISRPAVLLEIAEQVGLPVDKAREVLEQRTFKAAVDEDWNLARQYRITGCRPSSPAATAWSARSLTRRSKSWCGKSRSRATPEPMAIIDLSFRSVPHFRWKVAPGARGDPRQRRSAPEHRRDHQLPRVHARGRAAALPAGRPGHRHDADRPVDR